MVQKRRERRGRERELGQTPNSEKNDPIIHNIFKFLLDLRMHKNISEFYKIIVLTKD